MKVSVSEDYTIVLKEVFNSIVLETEEGNRFAICMRDDTVEMTVVGSGVWYIADMKTGEINWEGTPANGNDNKGKDSEFQWIPQQEFK